jgi:hypothetical protein
MAKISSENNFNFLNSGSPFTELGIYKRQKSPHALTITMQRTGLSIASGHGHHMAYYVTVCG